MDTAMFKTPKSRSTNNIRPPRIRSGCPLTSTRTRRLPHIYIIPSFSNLAGKPRRSSHERRQTAVTGGPPRRISFFLESLPISGHTFRPMVGGAAQRSQSPRHRCKCFTLIAWHFFYFWMNLDQNGSCSYSAMILFRKVGCLVGDEDDSSLLIEFLLVRYV